MDIQLVTEAELAATQRVYGHWRQLLSQLSVDGPALKVLCADRAEFNRAKAGIALNANRLGWTALSRYIGLTAADQAVAKLYRLTTCTAKGLPRYVAIQRVSVAQLAVKSHSDQPVQRLFALLAFDSSHTGLTHLACVQAIDVDAARAQLTSPLPLTALDHLLVEMSPSGLCLFNADGTRVDVPIGAVYDALPDDTSPLVKTLAGQTIQAY